MRNLRHSADSDRGAARSLSVRAALGVLVLSVVFVAGCSDSDSDSEAASGTPDVSPEGQVSYACALAEHVTQEYEEPTQWDSLVGEDASPGASEAVAAASLVGSSGGYELPDHPGLTEPGQDLVESVLEADTKQLASGLDAMVDACSDVPESSAPDVSEQGQADYACALAGYVIEEHGDAETWGGLGEEPAWHRAASVGALVGGMNGYVMPGAESLSETGKDIVEAVSRLDVEQLQESLDAFDASCDV